MVSMAAWTFHRLLFGDRWSAFALAPGAEVRGKGNGGTYWSMETLCPIPPNSPWKPIRLLSYGEDWIE